MKKYTHCKGDFKEKLQKFLETIISYINTPNVQWSINNIDDVKKENGMFSKLGEEWFDDYWKNYNKIVKPESKGEKIRNIYDFVSYRNGNIELIVSKRSGKNNG